MSRKQIPLEVELRVRLTAGYCCGYCLAPPHLLPWELELEHLLARANGGTDDEANLWLVCRSCNCFKGIQSYALDPLTNRRLRLFNPRRQKWGTHFKWGADGTQIIGLTATGRATVSALKLNNPFAVAARREWVSAGWHPPNDKH